VTAGRQASLVGVHLPPFDRTDEAGFESCEHRSHIYRVGDVKNQHMTRTATFQPLAVSAEAGAQCEMPHVGDAGRGHNVMGGRNSHSPDLNCLYSSVSRDHAPLRKLDSRNPTCDASGGGGGGGSSLAAAFISTFAGYHGAQPAATAAANGKRRRMAEINTHILWPNLSMEILLRPLFAFCHATFQPELKRDPNDARPLVNSDQRDRLEVHAP
jgi:hypothetical protein